MCKFKQIDEDHQIHYSMTFLGNIRFLFIGFFVVFIGFGFSSLLGQAFISEREAAYIGLIAFMIIDVYAFRCRSTFTEESKGYKDLKDLLKDLKKE